jgi:hypothetical protein
MPRPWNGGPVARICSGSKSRTEQAHSKLPTNSCLTSGGGAGDRQAAILRSMGIFDQSVRARSQRIASALFLRDARTASGPQLGAA